MNLIDPRKMAIVERLKAYDIETKAPQEAQFMGLVIKTSPAIPDDKMFVGYPIETDTDVQTFPHPTEDGKFIMVATYKTFWGINE